MSLTNWSPKLILFARETSLSNEVSETDFGATETSLPSHFFLLIYIVELGTAQPQLVVFVSDMIMRKVLILLPAGFIFHKKRFTFTILITAVAAVV